MKEPFSPPDMILAHDNFNAMCGHGALAAALGIRVMDVMQYFDNGGWVNIPMMKEAIRRAGHPIIKSQPYSSFGLGVALVQFLGRWMEPQVPAAARCAHRHWIAFYDGRIWDSNTMHWMTTKAWEDWIPALYSNKTTGHQIDSAWLIVP